MAYFTNEFKGVDYFEDIDFHHLEFYVGNAKQSKEFYKKIFGFIEYAYSGPETGVKDKVSYVLKKNNIFFVLTTPLKSNHPITSWLKKHGDGVYDVAFKVKSVRDAFEGCLSRGGISANDFKHINDKNGSFTKASLKSYGDCIHSIINNDDYNSWAPGFILTNEQTHANDTEIELIDHVVVNVELEKMDFWKDYYEKVFGFFAFVRFDETDISTKYSALKSVVVRSANWKVKLPINEPAEGLKKSQIEEYLDFNEGPGVQHIAIKTNNIIKSIKALRNNGVDFLVVPDSYYDDLKKRVGNIDEDIDKLKELNILVDRDEEGYLLQLFTKPIEDRPTLFIEIIQRKGSRGFGQGNFQALFESIEREQALRGNL